MANKAVCLLLAVFCFANLSSARQSPAECSKGPDYWCTNLSQAVDCGAVHHCTATVWETQKVEVRSNDVSNKFVRLFKELKDVRDLIDEEYPAIRVQSACSDIRQPVISSMCRKNTVRIAKPYVKDLLMSNTTAETMCTIIGMCNNLKLDNIISMTKNKANKPKPVARTELLGSQHCTWGPSYWCSNISTSHECRAIHHCVERVWSQMTVSEDTDSICKICTDMVQQARDQLESNETQSDLKAVFEGSCKLIPIRVVADECIKLADNFVPELVETLSSQMNPQVVCSVAGLCNSAKIDALLEEYNLALSVRAGCTGCRGAVGGLRSKFDATGYEDFLVSLLQVCTEMGSLSDSCSMLMFKYYENILAAVKQDFTPNSICHLSGQCQYQFHTHNQFTFPEENITYTEDVPCELCEQLVDHLRTTLVANTTEIEFQKILRGLCKQTGSFKAECLHIVDEYYEMIYNYMVNDLNSTKLCTMIGVCGRRQDVPIAPLLPAEAADKLTRVRDSDASAVQAAPLPLERMFVRLPQGKAECSFCQYFLHYLQVELSDVTNEEEIKKAVEKACEVLPSAVRPQCEQFVADYGPAVIALFVQEIDPASVCPALGLCPQTQQVRRVTVTNHGECPLCLFAVEQLETVLANNRSKTAIQSALDGLCNHLSEKLRIECAYFVDTYSRQLMESLLANMDAQEVCVYLRLCSDSPADPLLLARPSRPAHPSIDTFHQRPQLRADRNNRRKPMLPAHMLENGEPDVATNEIPDNTVNGRVVGPSVTSLPAAERGARCVMCEYLLSELEQTIVNINNTEEIIQAVHKVCSHLPQSVRAECNVFVDMYGVQIINKLIELEDPKKVCTALHLCGPNDATGTDPVLINVRPISPQLTQSSVCTLCQFVMTEIDEQIKDKNNQDEIENIVHNICQHMPQSVRADCVKFVDKYADLVISMLIQQLDPKKVCTELKLCKPDVEAVRAVQAVKSEILDCAVCESVVLAVKKVLSNDHIDRNIVHIVEKACNMLPAKYSDRCHTMMEIYGDSIIHLIEQFGTKAVCQKIGLCSDHSAAYVQLKYGQTRH